MERVNIYKDKDNLVDFGVYENKTLNNALFDVLFKIEYVSVSNDIENKILDIFNDAYYICTLILLEKHPYFNIKKYDKLIGKNKVFLGNYNATKAIIVMSMVYVYLNTLDMITNDIEKTADVIKAEFSGRDGNIFEKISSIVEIKEWSTKAYTFYPSNYPKDEQCSDYWKNYQNFPNEISSFINSHIETWVDKNKASEEEVRQIVNDYKITFEQDKSKCQQYNCGIGSGKSVNQNKRIKKLETEIQTYKVQNDSLQSELNLIRKEHTDVVSKYEKRIEELQKDLQTYKDKKQPPQLLLTNNSNFARVVQAMVSAHYFKRANGEETNATEVGSMLLKIFGVTNSWKSVLQKAFICENPLKTYDDLRDAGQSYWDERFGITDDIKKKGKK